MAARQRGESKLLWMQLPVGAYTMDKMSRDGQVRVADLWCPGIVGEWHLTRDILASQWISILLQQVIGLTLSSSFSRASLRLALLIISLRRVWRWGISLSESEGRRYVSTRRNGPLSTSWKALIILLFDYSKSRMNWESLPCLHRLQALQGSRAARQWRREVREADEWLYRQDFLDWVGD